MNHKDFSELQLIDNPVPWPDGARCAVAITFDLDVDSILHIAKPDKASSFVSTQSLLRYGAEVSVPRICKVFDHFSMKQTFFVPAWCVERYPAALETILKGGHEIGHHGYIHESFNTLSQADERFWIERAFDSYQRCIGIRPIGIRAPLNEFSEHTIDILIENGIEYDSSLMGDDVPYLLKSANGDGEVLEIPQFIGNDDYPQYMHNWDLGIEMTIRSPREATDVFRAEFDAQYENGGMWLTVWHPAISGRTARMREIIGLLEYIHDKGDVWVTTMGEINRHVRSCIASGKWKPRIDTLPYDISPVIELSHANQTKA